MKALSFTRRLVPNPPGTRRIPGFAPASGRVSMVRPSPLLTGPPQSEKYLMLYSGIRCRASAGPVKSRVVNPSKRTTLISILSFRKRGSLPLKMISHSAMRRC